MPDEVVSEPVAEPSLDDLLESAVSDLKADPTLAEPAAEPVAEPAKVEAAKVEPAKVEPPKPAEPDEAAKGLAAIARAEGRARQEQTAREAALAAREAQIAERERRLAEPAKPAQTGKTAAELRAEAEERWIESLGDQAPPEAQQRLALIQMRRELAETRKQIADRDAVQQQQTQQVQYQQQLEAARVEIEGKLSTFIPDALVHLKAKAAKRPGAVAKALLDRALQYRAADPTTVPDLAIVAADIERGLVEDFEDYKPIYAAPVAAAAAPKLIPPVADKQTPAAPRTLSNQLSTRTQPRVAEQSFDELFEETVANLKAGNLD